jgi:hypothetical protein
LVLVLKWSKTIQTGAVTPLIPIPAIPNSGLDPVKAYKQLLHTNPTITHSQPLLSYKLAKRMHVLSSALLNRILADMICVLGLDHQDYSFHSLRRGGATTAYNSGVSLAQVMRHGTWKTQSSFWKYITQPAVKASPVAAALSRAVSKVS